ncbi:efflux RND transporter periplasmic adaptor subunit [Treponema sp. OttesenSCG-928-L16]|nr:efflux RND transporter periplasmic adaptor subunit [Treponema sp. OttesenSCG-928-L16]
MSKQVLLITAAVVSLFLLSCGNRGESVSDRAGMEQLHTQNGRPVNVRQIEAEPFSVYLTYPGTIYAQSESTAYAAISDVVRSVNVRVGDRVEQDQVILSLSQDNQACRQAALAWENAQKSYERSRLLFASGDISRQSFDTIAAEYDLAETNYSAALDIIHIKAPISGTITQLSVHPSTNVNAGEPLFTVSGQSGYEGLFYVGADEIEHIRLGGRVIIGLGGSDGAAEGRITRISLAMDSVRQAFPVSASFDTDNRRLASGMGADLAVETYRNEKAIVVSRSELTRTEEGFQVYIAQGNKAEALSVELGQVQGSKYEVIRGLESGDFLVCDGSRKLVSPETKAGGLAMAKAE